MFQGLVQRLAPAVLPRGSMTGTSIAQTRKAMGDKGFTRWANSQLAARKEKRMKPGALFEKHKKNWIAGAIKHPGALHRQLGVAQGKKIPSGKLAAAAKKGGKLGRRARLAETLKGLHHKRGGKKKKPIPYKSGKYSPAKLPIGNFSHQGRYGKSWTGYKSLDLKNLLNMRAGLVKQNPADKL